MKSFCAIKGTVHGYGPQWWSGEAAWDTLTASIDKGIWTTIMEYYAPWEEGAHD